MRLRRVQRRSSRAMFRRRRSGALCSTPSPPASRLHASTYSSAFGLSARALLDRLQRPHRRQPLLGGHLPGQRLGQHGGRLPRPVNSVAVASAAIRTSRLLLPSWATTNAAVFGPFAARLATVAFSSGDRTSSLSLGLDATAPTMASRDAGPSE